MRDVNRRERGKETQRVTTGLPRQFQKKKVIIVMCYCWDIKLYCPIQGHAFCRVTWLLSQRSSAAEANEIFSKDRYFSCTSFEEIKCFWILFPHFDSFDHSTVIHFVF